MVTKHVLDTHTLLWFVIGSSSLGTNAKSVLQDPLSELILPATALAEAFWIIERGRVALALPDLLHAIDSDLRILLFPLDRSVITKSNGLRTIGEMHDRQIVATALLLADRGDRVVLLTKDANITASGLVPIAW